MPWRFGCQCQRPLLAHCSSEAAGSDSGNETVEFQCIHAAGEDSNVPLYVGGEVGRIEDIPIWCLTADKSWHGAAPQALEQLWRGDRSNLISLVEQPFHIRGKRNTG